ncbi:DUF1353 domain-containing protein [Actinophytocola sp. NPDC049390]|uniref:DUF1353 domain-containing protein n=1 Tax=Actinophytocola sp. NPDC049390 TaxID=3363894 RepID=UPI00379CECD5
MPFLSGPPRVEQVDAKRWRLLRSVQYAGDLGVLVPVGYVTDFASVPRLLWWFTPPSGEYTLAAIVHDYLISDSLPAGYVSSPEVDREFRVAMQSLDVGFVRRWLMWAGVRWAAVLNPVRRPGWLRTLPQLLLVTALALAPVAAGLAFILI